MDVRNRMADVVKLRCNVCQDFIRMILKEGWQKELYKKAQEEIMLEPGEIDHSESTRNDQSRLIRNSQCTSMTN